MPHPAPIRPSIALAAFAEKFIDGRRIVVFGNALSPFWEQLIERGARLVHVCDADTSRVSEAAARNTSQHVSFAPLAGNGLAVRDGAFDVGFVENLSTYSDPATTLHRLRRALSSRGVAIVAAPNPDVEDALIAGSTDQGRVLDYYSLYDCVHREFPVVRMAGQMPFVGYSVAELAPAEDPVPCIDAGFVPGGTEEPEWFVAIATLLDVQFDSFVVVQLPCDQLTKHGSERLLREQLRAARSAERSAVERLSRLEAEQRRLSEAAQRHQKDVDLARQMRLLQEELERKESWILQLEARAATADARADEADQELDELRQQFGLGTDDSGKSVGPTEDWRKTIERLESEKCELFAKSASAETQYGELEQRSASQQATSVLRLKQVEDRLQQVEQSLETTQAESSTRLLLLESQRTEAEQRLAEANRHVDELTESQRTLAEQRLAEATCRIEALTESGLAQERASSSELGQLEAQLQDRGERIRVLEQELKRTEEVGKQLVRELERSRAQDAAKVFATDTWAQGSLATTTAASTHLSADRASAWVESKGLAPAPVQSLNETLDRLAGLAAKQHADLVAYEWCLQQLLDEGAALGQRVEKFDELTNELEHARALLQRHEVLFAELGASKL